MGSGEGNTPLSGVEDRDDKLLLITCWDGPTQGVKIFQFKFGQDLVDRS